MKCKIWTWVLSVVLWVAAGCQGFGDGVDRAKRAQTSEQRLSHPGVPSSARQGGGSWRQPNVRVRPQSSEAPAQVASIWVGDQQWAVDEEPSESYLPPAKFEPQNSLNDSDVSTDPVYSSKKPIGFIPPHFNPTKQQLYNKPFYSQQKEDTVNFETSNAKNTPERLIDPNVVNRFIAENAKNRRIEIGFIQEPSVLSQMNTRKKRDLRQTQDGSIPPQNNIASTNKTVKGKKRVTQKRKSKSIGTEKSIEENSSTFTPTPSNIASTNKAVKDKNKIVKKKKPKSIGNEYNIEKNSMLEDITQNSVKKSKIKPNQAKIEEITQNSVKKSKIKPNQAKIEEITQSSARKSKIKPNQAKLEEITQSSASKPKIKRKQAKPPANGTTAEATVEGGKKTRTRKKIKPVEQESLAVTTKEVKKAKSKKTKDTKTNLTLEVKSLGVVDPVISMKTNQIKSSKRSAKKLDKLNVSSKLQEPAESEPVMLNDISTIRDSPVEPSLLEQEKTLATLKAEGKLIDAVGDSDSPGWQDIANKTTKSRKKLEAKPVKPKNRSMERPKAARRLDFDVPNKWILEGRDRPPKTMPDILDSDITDYIDGADWTESRITNWTEATKKNASRNKGGNYVKKERKEIFSGKRFDAKDKAAKWKEGRPSGDRDSRTRDRRLPDGSRDSYRRRSDYTPSGSFNKDQRTDGNYRGTSRRDEEPDRGPYAHPRSDQGLWDNQRRPFRRDQNTGDRDSSRGDREPQGFQRRDQEPYRRREYEPNRKSGDWSQRDERRNFGSRDSTSRRDDRTRPQSSYGRDRWQSGYRRQPEYRTRDSNWKDPRGSGESRGSDRREFRETGRRDGRNRDDDKNDDRYLKDDPNRFQNRNLYTNRDRSKKTDTKGDGEPGINKRSDNDMDDGAENNDPPKKKKTKKKRSAKCKRNRINFIKKMRNL